MAYFLTYQRLDFARRGEVTDETRDFYGVFEGCTKGPVWCVRVQPSMTETLAALSLCTPSFFHQLLVIRSNTYVKIDKVAWYKALGRHGSRPVDFISDTVDDTHAEYVVPFTPETECSTTVLRDGGDRFVTSPRNLFDGMGDDTYRCLVSAHDIVRRRSDMVDLGGGHRRSRMSGAVLFAANLTLAPLLVQVVHGLPDFDGEPAPVWWDGWFAYVSANARRFVTLMDCMSVWSVSGCDAGGFDRLLDEMRGFYALDDNGFGSRLAEMLP